MAIFLENKEKVKQYLIKSKREVKKNLGNNFKEFYEKCEGYIKTR